MGPPPSSPLDLVGTYITPSAHGIGRRLSLQTIDKRLARLPLRRVLRLLALTAFRADRSINDQGERLALARDLLPPGPEADRAQALIKQAGVVLVSSQHALSLAVRALVHCPDDVPTRVRDLPRTLGELMVALGEPLGKGKDGPDELMLEILRLGLFYRLHGVGDWYSTAAELFFDVLPSLSHDHEHVDVAAVVRNGLGLAVEEYWAISASLGMVLMGSPKLTIFPTSVGTVPPATMARWSDSVTQDISEARAKALEDVAANSTWALTTFFAKPVIRDVGPDGDYAMRPQLLALKATVIGMYHLVFDLLKAEGGGRHLQWSRFFGRAVEAYGRRLLAEHLPNPSCMSFPDERPADASHLKACDVLIDDGGALIALDFVHRALQLATQTTGSPTALGQDLSVAIIGKVDQIDATLEASIERRSDVSRIFPAIVMSGPLPMNPLLESRISELIAGAPRSVVGVDGRCRPVAVLELYELKMLLLTVTENNVAPADVLDAWLQSPLGGNNFRDWLVSQDKLKPGCWHPGDAWEARVRALFREAEA